jgi:hypothetical protein
LEAKIRRIAVEANPGQTGHENLSQKNPSQKRTSIVAPGVGPEFKPQHCKEKKKNFCRSRMFLVFQVSLVINMDMREIFIHGLN